MKIHLSVLFFTILIGFFNIYSQTVPPPKSDVQFWNETQVIFPLLKKKDVKGKEFERILFFINGTLRFGRNISHFADERIGFGFDFKLNKNITFTPSYLYRADQPYKNKKEFETRLRFALTLEKKFEKFSIKDRNLIEYRMRNSRADSTRYRNKSNFTFPFIKNKKEVFSPFLADEIYYDFSEKEFTRNEFSAGISKKFNKNLTADFFYLLQKNKGNVLSTINAFGINLKIKVD